MLKNPEYEQGFRKRLIHEFGTNNGIGNGQRTADFDLKLVTFRSFKRFIKFFWKIVNNADKKTHYKRYQMLFSRCYEQKKSEQR